MDALRKYQETGNANAAKKLLRGAQSFASVEGKILTSLARGRLPNDLLLYRDFLTKFQQNNKFS